MIEEVDCTNCKDNCCLKAYVGLTVFDIARILYLRPDCEFIESERGFGEIKYKGETLIVIDEGEMPGASIIPPCKLLDKELRCTLHNESIPADSTLGRILKSNNQQLHGKPFACAKHPYIYEPASDKMLKLADCRVFDKNYIDTGEDKNHLLDAILGYSIEHRILNIIWAKTGEYLIVQHAESFIKGVE